jgi:type I restriction enzyme S subunit
MEKKRKTPQLRFRGFQEEWEEKELGKLSSLITKGTSPLDTNGDRTVNFVKIENISALSGEINTSTKITLKEHEGYLKRSQLHEDDVLFSIAGTLGRVSVVNKDILPANTNQALAIIRFKKGNIKYVTTFLKGKAISEYLKKNPTVGAQPNLSLEQVGSLDISLPLNEEEQTQIATFFQHLDALIDLRRRKLDKLTAVKKAMLEKMFPKEGADAPEIRFKGFTGKWERRKYCNVFTVLSNNTLSRADLNLVSGIAKNIHYGDVLIKFGELTDSKKDAIPFITDNHYAEKNKSSMLQNGDLIIADTAEDETAGKCTELINTNGENIVSGLHTIPCRPVFPFALGYLGYFMNSFSFHNQLLRLMQGTKVLSISKAVLQDTNIYYPQDITEQSQIAAFFQHLDSLIALQGRELDKLKQIKKACLEKMFA